MMSERNEHFDIERLNAIPISGVARRLGVELQRSGSSYRALCPWHDDHRPSLHFDERTGKNRCKCFACGKGGDVIAYAMQQENWTFREVCQWLSQQYGIPMTGDFPQARHRYYGNIPLPKPKERPKPELPAYTYIPQEMLDAIISVDSSLCRCLKLMFQSEAVDWVADEYRIGCYAMKGLDDYTVFPSIDAEGRICNLKVQHYDIDPFSPRFAHSDPDSCRWLGSIWVREGRLPKEAKFKSDCLFGEHLLPRYPNHQVILVESPKNALFGALAYPQMIWVATGNKSQFKREVLRPLRGRDVIVIPDGDAVEEWSAAIDTMTDLANFTVTDFCKRIAPIGETKYDIADYLQELHPPMPF